MSDTLPPSPRRRPRFWLRFLLIVGFVAAAPLCWFGFDRLRAHWRLQAAYAEADRLDSGWRERTAVPDDENGALVVVKVLKHFPKGDYSEQWKGITLDPALTSDEVSAWHLAFANALTDLPENVALNSQQHVALAVEVDAWKQAVAEAHALSRFRAGRFPHTQQRDWPYSAEMPRSRSLLDLLRWDVFLTAHRKDWPQAAASTRAAFGLARAIGDEHNNAGQTLRIVHNLIACDLAGRLVGQGEPPAALLAELRNDMRSECAQSLALSMVRGLRVDTQRMFASLTSNALKKGEDEIVARMVAPRKKGENIFQASTDESWLEKWRGRASRDWTGWHANLVEAANEWTVIAHLPFPEQVSAYKAKGANALTEIALEELHRKPIGASFRIHAQLRATEAGLAVECYRQKYGRWPERLDELTPEFWDAVPIDIYTGKPLLYRRHKDGVAVYSVGEDEKDNHGTTRHELDEEFQPFPDGLDFGLMLWDVAKRRAPAQPPLPLPEPRAVDGDDP